MDPFTMYHGPQSRNSELCTDLCQLRQCYSISVRIRFRLFLLHHGIRSSSLQGDDLCFWLGLAIYRGRWMCFNGRGRIGISLRPWRQLIRVSVNGVLMKRLSLQELQVRDCESITESEYGG